MKNKSYLALLAIPLAGLGIVSSVAFAQTNPPTTPVAPTTQSAQVEQATGPDTGNVQDQASDNRPDSALEAKGVEAPEGGAEVNDGPGGHQDTGATVDHQFEGVE